MAAVRKGAVKLKGSPVDLRGPALKVGDKAPVAEVVDNGLQPVKVGGPGDRVRIFSAVPSLDTPVCDLQTKRFNDEVAKSPGLQVDTISVDLPFAQKRWCAAAGAANVRTLSDYRGTSFGDAYGLTVDSGPLSRMLARAVFVVDKAGTVKHAEYVSDISQHPNYDAALAVARSLGG
jgi:thioredoxin-dependent peroxiredoxin